MATVPTLYRSRSKATRLTPSRRRRRDMAVNLQYGCACGYALNNQMCHSSRPPTDGKRRSPPRRRRLERGLASRAAHASLPYQSLLLRVRAAVPRTPTRRGFPEFCSCEMGIWTLLVGLKAKSSQGGYGLWKERESDTLRRRGGQHGAMGRFVPLGMLPSRTFGDAILPRGNSHDRRHAHLVGDWRTLT